LNALSSTLLTPEGGLAGVFVSAFLAATVVPFSSEAVLFAYLRLHPEQSAAAIALATLGNTAGGMTSYAIGRFLPAKAQRKLEPRTLGWLQRHGAPATLLAWLPIVGDALCVAAGWLRVAWLPALAFMAAGRLARYLVVASL
jgi:membrane protein YqaA with SNARE-associated domain